MGISEGKEAAIRGLHEYKQELQSQIRCMQENLHHVERSIELLSNDGGVVVSPAAASSGAITGGASVSISVSPYSTLKGQAAVELFLHENPGRWYKASVLAKELLRRGFPKTSKHFVPIITGALNRATDKGLAIKEKRDGVFKWRSTQENGSQTQE